MSPKNKEIRVGSIRTKRETVFRTNIIKMADDLLMQYEAERILLANIIAIDGMGKSTFIEQVMPSRLKRNKILYKVMTIHPHEDVSRLAINVLEWITSELKVKVKTTGLKNSRPLIETAYSSFLAQVSAEENKTRFALLVDDLDNLTFDDLGWFQSTVLETINAVALSAMIVTSHNELNWHSWELRNHCKRIQLEGFTQEELNDICPSSALSQKIFQLSAGHPATVESLLDISNQKYQDLTAVDDTELVKLNNALLEGLREEIEKNLSARIKIPRLKEIFWLSAPADGFDTDLINDIVKEFGIEALEDITDIAWELAYTGLAMWDFDAKIYKMAPDLRNRIIAYMQEKRKNDLTRGLETIAKSYLMRADILTKWQTQIIRFIDYFSLSKTIDGYPLKKIVVELVNLMQEWLEANEKRDQLLKAIDERRKVVTSSALHEVYNRLLLILRGDEGLITENRIENDGGGPMLTHSKTALGDVKSSLLRTREEAENDFRKLIDGQLDTKWLLAIQGDWGIGKSYLLKQFISILEEENYPFAFVDLHYPENQKREAILKVGIQLGIKDVEYENAIIGFWPDQRKEKTLFMGIEEPKSFDYPYDIAATTLALAIEKKPNKPVIIIDTFDDNPGVSQLSLWMFPQLIKKLNRIAYVIIAGRKPVYEVENLPEEVRNGIHFIGLEPFSNKEIRDLIIEAKVKGLEVTEKLVNSIVRLSGRNPLAAKWIVFYLAEIVKSKENWEEVMQIKDKEEILRRIAENIMNVPPPGIPTNEGEPERRALQAAMHFGSHFNLELFKAVIPESELGGKRHEAIFEKLGSYFYTRGTPEHWTLHDQIREWMLEIPDLKISTLIKLSNKAIDNYYRPKIESFLEERTSEEQDRFDDLRAQRLYHILFTQSHRTEPAYKSELYHLELWSHLDNLWHRYRLEQMGQVIDFGRQVQRWNPRARGDILITNILNAAEGWINYTRADYKKARRSATAVKDNENAPKRLRATAQVILGLLPDEKPQEAIRYLESAQLLYDQILNDLRNDKLENGEFTDRSIDIFPEKHQVLMSIGRMYLTHYFDLNEAENAFRKATELSRDPVWRQPMYEATALNEWARVLRFGGQFSDASDKIMLAISIFKKLSAHPENEINLGYFYETFALIEKEQGQYRLAQEYLERALRVYENIIGPMEARKATILLEKGHTLFLAGQLQEAESYIIEAHEVFKSEKDKHPWYYLNSLNKLGEYYIRINDLDQAKKCFEEQKEFAIIYGHDLWEYWARQYLAFIDYEKGVPIQEERLEELLKEFAESRNRKLGPAFWQTKLLLFRIAKSKGDISSGLTHLTEGLIYLAGHWKAQFWQNLAFLRNELLNLEPDVMVQEANRLRKLWKDKFPDVDPSPKFVDMCDFLIRSL
jgi:tetratricopeptide (TPR) repeat protein